MSLPFLQSWYQQQCNGFWEHSYGVTIETLDNPGWMVTVDLTETPLERATMEPVRRERSPRDWLVCEVAQRQFRGQGDSQKLSEILTIFQTWVTQLRSGQA